MSQANCLRGWIAKTKPNSKSQEWGWHGGESTRLPPMWPGFHSRFQRHMWIEFVVDFALAPRVFFDRPSGFSSLLKSQHFQIPIRSGIRGPHVCQWKNCLVSPSLNKRWKKFTCFFLFKMFRLQTPLQRQTLSPHYIKKKKQKKETKAKKKARYRKKGNRGHKTAFEVL